MSINGPLGATPQSGAIDIGVRPRTRRVQTLAPTRAGQIALAGLVLTALLVCIAASRTTALLPEYLDTSMEGPFRSISFHLPVGLLFVVMGAMFGCYLVAVREAERLSMRAVIATIAALNAVILLAPPLFSTDVFSYQAYAREWITLGANPYLHGPAAVMIPLTDPFYSYIGAKWINIPTVYGPVFTGLSAFLAPLSIAGAVMAYKGIAALSSLIVCALLWNGARLRGLNPTRAVALFALNPLVVVFGVGGGHNDLLMLAAATAGIYALLAHRERTSGAMIMLATAMKLTAGLLLPFAMAAGVGLGAEKRRRSLLIGAGVTAAAIAAIAFSLFGVGIFNLIPTLHTVQVEGDWHSIPGSVTAVTREAWAGQVIGLMLGLVFVVVFVKLIRRVWRGEMDWIDGAGWATLVMLVTASSVEPWYVAWLLPLVALCSDRRLWRWSLILSGVMLFTTILGLIPHGDTFLGITLVP